MPRKDAVETRRRIFESAAILFSRGGYTGASVRDIAQAADVNEATIFRHYPRKRELYLAVLESELQKVRLRGDLLAAVAGASDARTALESTFALIAATLTEQQDVLRLLQFGSLELGRELDPLLRKNLGELIEVVAGYLQPWIDRDELQSSNARATVLTFIAIALNYHALFALFAEDLPSMATTLDVQADVYSAVASS